ncbi:MAG: hypothetical protein HC890_08360 [Chloroflexaceae bacterium]|nr:hypothetical protein [Chloroflexaceae bacterium]
MMPTLMLFAAVNLREVVIVYLLTLSMFFLVSWHSNKKNIHLVLSLLLALLGGAFHTGLILSLIVSFAILFASRFIQYFIKFLFTRKTVLLSLLRYMVIFAAVVFLATLVVLSGWGLSRLGGDISNLSAEQVIQVQQRFEDSDAKYLINLRATSLFDFVWQAPIRLIFFLFTPFPWQIRGITDLVSQIDVLVNVYLAVSLYKSRQLIASKPAAQALVVILISCILVFATSTSNSGNALRHRSKFSPIAICLLASPDSRERVEKFKQIRFYRRNVES